MIYIISMTKI